MLDYVPRPHGLSPNTPAQPDALRGTQIGTGGDSSRTGVTSSDQRRFPEGRLRILHYNG
jgi:hypothetical protein